MAEILPLLLNIYIIVIILPFCLRVLIDVLVGGGGVLRAAAGINYLEKHEQRCR
jgi:hypothetical protein